MSPRRRRTTLWVLFALFVVVPLADGTRRILAVTAAPISAPGAPGLRAGAVSVYRDVTEERRHVELLDAMTESMTEGLIVVDADGKVLHSELVPQIGQEPDYDAALAAL